MARYFDVKVGPITFDDDYEIEEYAKDVLGFHDPMDCGWTGMNEDTYRELGIEYGFRDDIDVYAYHDDNQHAGSVKFCSDTACQSL
jgi:hypothetical protein